MNATNARAFALTRRPVGKTAHKSIDGNVHSCSTARTTPRSSSGANIHCDAIASPRSASTASRTPSAAVMRNRPSATTDVSVLPFGACGPKADWQAEEINLAKLLFAGQIAFLARRPEG